MAKFSDITDAALGAAGAKIGSMVGNAISGALSGAASSTAVQGTLSALSGNGINIAKISNARVFLEGRSLVGMAEMVTGMGFPRAKFDDFKALGLLSTMKLFSAYEQPEVKIKWTSIYKEVASTLYDPLHTKRIQIRASQEIYSSSGLVKSVPLVAEVDGFFTDNGEASVEQGTAVTHESTITVNYSKLTINNFLAYEYDVTTNIFRVGGQDIFAQIFANMGA